MQNPPLWQVFAIDCKWVLIVTVADSTIKSFVENPGQSKLPLGTLLAALTVSTYTWEDLRDVIVTEFLGRCLCC